MIVLTALAPHPPVIVPEIGGGQAKQAGATGAAMEKLAAAVARAEPETLVVFTPHGHCGRDQLFLSGQGTLGGSLARWGSSVRRSWPADEHLAGIMAEVAESAGLRVDLLPEKMNELDHGVMVPLHFLAGSLGRARLVVVGMGFLPLDELYLFGACTARAAQQAGRRIAVLASGDLSHYLSDESPYGYNPAGPKFDRQLVDLLSRTDVPGILGIDPGLAEEAGECGYRTIVMMLGSLDGLAVEAEVLSYEGPFGIGYAVAVFHPSGEDPARRFARAAEGAHA